jgi:hypothetical protein
VIPAERIKAFLLDPDPLVSDAAFDYFSESYSPDPELLTTAMHVCSQRTAEGCLHVLVKARNFAVTDAALGLVLEQLARTTDINAAGHLNRIVAGAPIELMSARAAELRRQPHIKPKTFERLARRGALAELPGAELWSRLQAFAQQSEAAYVNDLDHDHANDLVEALARHAVPDDDTLVRLLATADGSWLEIFLVDLAGHRRCAAAVAALVAKYAIDTDYLRERTSDALARIGDPLAVRLIHAGYATSSWDSRLYSTTLLERLPHPATEDAALDLLPREDDIALRTKLAVVLCKLYSERGVEAVRSLIRDGFDSMMINLEEELLAILPVLGIDLPEAALWRKKVEERVRMRIERAAEFDRMMRTKPPARAPGPPAPRRILPPRPAATVKGRVGRNDRCPCGSGKKFKQCCLTKRLL